MRKFIFLDVDGVLNCATSESRCGSYVGIDNSKVELLAKIVSATDAKIVLVSSWKLFWFRTDKEEQDELANYLDRKLKRFSLRIIDKTFDNGDNRGEGIAEWLKKNGWNDCSWIVLDDNVFEDYGKYVGDHLVKTTWANGLTEELAEKAITKLNAENNV